MSDPYVITLSYEELDPQTTRHEHEMGKREAADLAVYRVLFTLTLSSGESHPGMLMHLFSKRLLGDAIYLDPFEYFEDRIRVYIEENGWPGKALESKENSIPV